LGAYGTNKKNKLGAYPSEKKGKRKQDLRQILHVLVVLSQNETGFTGKVNRFAFDPYRINFDWL